MKIELSKAEIDIIVQLMLRALPQELQQLLQKLTAATQEASAQHTNEGTGSNG